MSCTKLPAFHQQATARSEKGSGAARKLVESVKGFIKVVMIFETNVRVFGANSDSGPRRTVSIPLIT